MSYRCTICFEHVSAGIACHKRVTKKKVKHYSERACAKKEWREVKGKWKKVWIPDPGGIGFETVHEASCCPRCALELDNEQLSSG